MHLHELLMPHQIQKGFSLNRDFDQRNGAFQFCQGLKPKAKKRIVLLTSRFRVGLKSLNGTLVFRFIKHTLALTWCSQIPFSGTMSLPLAIEIFEGMRIVLETRDDA
jgi:hypothetical protein